MNFQCVCVYLLSTENAAEALSTETKKFCSFGWGVVARKVWLPLAPKVTLKAVTVNGTEQAAATVKA